MTWFLNPPSLPLKSWFSTLISTKKFWREREAKLNKLNFESSLQNKTSIIHPPLHIALSLQSPQYPSHHLTSKLHPLSLSLSVKMEVTSYCQHNNKENIPPFAQNQIYPAPPVVQTCSPKNAKRRLMRRPLRDITHLFNSQTKSDSARDTGFQLHSPVPAPALYLRKRKAVYDIDSVNQMNSKSLRMNFR